MTNVDIAIKNRFDGEQAFIVTAIHRSVFDAETLVNQFSPGALKKRSGENPSRLFPPDSEVPDSENIAVRGQVFTVNRPKIENLVRQYCQSTTAILPVDGL